MTRVFLSYSHADRAFASRLSSALVERGLEVWIDEKGIHGGARWSTSVQEGLDRCDALVLVVSPSSMASSNVEDEWQYVLDKGKPVVPVLHEPADLHFQLGRIQHIDFVAQDFEPALRQLVASIERATSAVARDRGADGNSSDAEDSSTLCPYRGLHAFREEDAPFFFGREVFTKRLVETLQAKPMVGVIGPSGSGKSSVVMAGMLPALRMTEGSSRTSGGDWTVLQLRPGAEPFHALAGALVPRLEPEMSRTARMVESARLAEALADGTISVAKVVHNIRDVDPRVGPLLFIVDQFEELYTLCPDVAMQRRFQDLLFETAFGAAGDGAGAGLVRLALTLRADFMGHATAYRPFSDAIQDHNVILGPMNAEELTRVIARPAELQGRTFEPGLVERIRRDVGEEAGSLPLLEFALTKLWESQVAQKLTHASYEALGQVEGAVARHADAVFEGLDVADRALARKVIVQMVRPGEGTEDTRRIARRDELGDEGWGLVRQLADARLVVTNRDEEGRETAEVVHEALIRTWGRLKEWMAEDRRFRTWQERLRFAIRQWEEAGRDEGALLRGVPLAEAEAWIDRRGHEVLEVERAFVERGVARQQDAASARAALERRSRRRLQLVAATTTVGLVVASALGWLALRQSRRNLVDATVSRSEQLRVSGQEDLSLALAVEAAIAAPEDPEVILNLSRSAYAPGTKYVIDGPAPFTSLSLSPDDAWLAAGDKEGVLRVYDADTGALAGEFQAHEGQVRDVDFGPDGRVLTGGDDQQVVLWDWRAEREVHRLDGHRSQVQSVAISPDGRHGISGGSLDGLVVVWNLERGEALHEQRVGTRRSRVRDVRFNPDGDTAAWAVGSPEGKFMFWDMERMHVSRRVPYGSADAVAFTPGRRRVVLLSPYGRQVWRLGAEEPISTAATRGSLEGKAVAFGTLKSLLLHTQWSEIALIDVDSGNELRRFAGHTGEIHGIDVASDGSFGLLGLERHHDSCLATSRAPRCWHRVDGLGPAHECERSARTAGAWR